MGVGTIVLSIVNLFFLFSLQSRDDGWMPLLDKNLSQWEAYLSYRHTSLTITSAPKDSNGIPMNPIGLNNDTCGVFSVIEENGEPVLRVTGEIYGSLCTLKEYGNYHLQLKVKWGKKKWPPRLQEVKDSGVLYHSVGDYGVDYWLTWKLSHEFQIQQECFGDYWSIAGAKADIRSRLPEGEKAYIYDKNAPLVSAEKRGYCRRSKDCELPEGEWNTLDLICFDAKSLQIVNGNVVLALQNSRYYKDGVEIPLTKGKIQIQSEGAEVFYKDIKIMPIDSLPAEFVSYF